jgi:hypothetical protein
MVSLGFVTDALGPVPGFPRLRLRLADGRTGPLLQCDGRRVGAEHCILTWTASPRTRVQDWRRDLADCLGGLGWEQWRLAQESWKALGGLDPRTLDAFADAFWPVYRPVGRAKVLLELPEDHELRETARSWGRRHGHLRFDLDTEPLINPPAAAKKRIRDRIGPLIPRNLKVFSRRNGNHGHRRVRTGKN